MADSSPLLPPRTPSGNQPQRAAEKAASPSFDDTIEQYVGGTSSSQLFQAFFASLAWLFDSQQTFINIFTDAEPSWHCTRAGDPSCSHASNPCSLPKGSWAWDLPKHTSIVSEWDLECSLSALAGFPASAYFVGSLIGGLLLATLADSVLGRKKMLFFSCLTMSLTGALIVMSPNIWVYSAMRFICGFGRATVLTCALVLSTEIVGKKWRDGVSFIGFICFGLGFLSLPAIAYAIRGSSWRTLYLWTSVPSLCYSILLYFLVQESPRWLLLRGQRENAIRMLRSMAASNGRNVITSSFSTLVVPPEDIGLGTSAGIFTTLKILWRKRWAFRRLMAIMTVIFGAGIIYYGMPLNVGNLTTNNIYLSVAYNALAELPSSLVAFFCIENFNRRSSTLMVSILSGACSILCVFLKAEGLKMAAEVVSFFSACTAVDIALVYSIELFPTCVRNSAISLVRLALVLGGVFAPILVVQGRKKSTFLSFGVFGLVIGCCGLFATCLPETRGRSMCDTMEEEEDRETSSKYCPSVI